MHSYNKDLALEAISASRKEVEEALEKIYPDEENGVAGKLYGAVRYSLLSGGKRIRATLCLESCRLLGGNTSAAVPYAAAIEMIHTYSLIHDDLPCMDDDDVRRGRPTNHKVYGEALATLAGDALLTDAFAVCASNPYVDSDVARKAVSALSSAAGGFGMVRGQAIDMRGESEELSESELVELHECKTGAMIRAAIRLGCLAAGADGNGKAARALELFGRNVGLVFQIIDDVLDVTASTEELGKSAGSDKESNKTTFLSFYDVDGAEAYAERLTEEAVSAVADIEGSERLVALALYLCDRKY